MVDLVRPTEGGDHMSYSCLVRISPVRREALDGQQRAELYICENLTPGFDRESMFGVLISEP